MLRIRNKGDYVQQNQGGDRTCRSPVGSKREDNVLLKAFHRGGARGAVGCLHCRSFSGEDTGGLDQLLMIRLGQRLGAAQKSCGVTKESGSESAPICRAGRTFL